MALAGLAFARLIAALAGFWVTTLLARALGPTDWGRLAMLLALQGQALLIAELGLRSVMTADCGHDAAAVRRGLRRYLGLRLVLAGAVAAAALPAAVRLVPGSAAAATLLLSTLFASALLFDWVALALGRPLEAGLPLMTRPLVAALAVGIPMAFGYDPSFAAAAALLACGWWASAFVSLAALRHLPAAAERPLPAVSVLFGRALPLGLAAIAAQATLALDILLVGYLLGASVAAQYQIATAVLTAGLIFANAASQLGLARAGRLRDGPADLRRSLLPAFAAMTALGLGLTGVTACVGPLLLTKIFGDAYSPAAGLLLWLLPWFALQHPGSWLQGVLAGLARERTVLRANVAALTIGLVLFIVGSRLGDPRLVALGRGAAELVRILFLLAALVDQARTMPISDARLPSCAPPHPFKTFRKLEQNLTPEGAGRA